MPLGERLRLRGTAASAAGGNASSAPDRDLPCYSRAKEYTETPNAPFQVSRAVCGTRVRGHIGDQVLEGNDDSSAPKVGFPIVAIGASAGGLEALRQLFARLPDDTGMAFVVIQHLDPGRPSMLSSVLAADVRMPVVEAAHGMRAEPNRVYVIPPGSDLEIHQGRLTLVPRQQTHKLHLPID